METILERSLPTAFPGAGTQRRARICQPPRQSASTKLLADSLQPVAVQVAIGGHHHHHPRGVPGPVGRVAIQQGRVQNAQIRNVLSLIRGLRSPQGKRSRIPMARMETLSSVHDERLCIGREPASEPIDHLWNAEKSPSLRMAWAQPMRQGQSAGSTAGMGCNSL